MSGEDDTSDVELQQADTATVRSTWTASESPSFAVVEAVAAITGREPTDLPPLADRLDTDALDSLLGERTPGWSRPVSVSFEYAGVDVSLRGEGSLEVRLADDDGPTRTATEFQEGLERLVESATRHGVPLEGGWDCGGSPDGSSWDVHITSVSTRDEGPQP